MTSTNITPAPTTAPPRRRWWRAVLLLVALLVAVPAAYWGYTYWATNRAWEEAEAEAALDLPRWKLLEMEADRPQYADADNSALHLIATLRQGGRISVSAAPGHEAIFAKLPPTAQLNHLQSELIRRELAKIPKPLEEARKLKDKPRGRIPVTVADDGISTPIPNHQDARTLVDWLQHDAMLRGDDRDYDGAMDSCAAIFNIGRVFDGESFLISFLIRLTLQRIAIVQVERVLAQGEPGEDRLRAMQAILERDIPETDMLQGVRGERGMIHHFFSNARAGKVELKSGWLRNLGGMSGSGRDITRVTQWTMDVFPSTAFGYYPEVLHRMNAAVDIAKLPIHEREAKFQEWEDAWKKSANPLCHALFVKYSTIHKGERRTQALLRSLRVAVACERYRRTHEDRWPASLDDLVKAKLLDAVPRDPFDDQPLRYRRTKDGVAIYSVGFDRTDNQGNIDHDRVYDPGFDTGIRLWNVEARRQDPLPPVAIPEGKGG